jgi:hypothetical protein
VANKGRVRERALAWSASNKDRVRERYAVNKERVLERQRARYAAKNKARVRQAQEDFRRRIQESIRNEGVMPR